MNKGKKTSELYAKTRQFAALPEQKYMENPFGVTKTEKGNPESGQNGVKWCRKGKIRDTQDTPLPSAETVKVCFGTGSGEGGGLWGEKGFQLVGRQLSLPEFDPFGIVDEGKQCSHPATLQGIP